MSRERVTVSLTTDASGDASSNTTMLSGFVERIEYDGGFDAAADFTIATENGVTVWTESGIAKAATSRTPRIATNATDGSASLYAAAGTAVLAPIFVHDEVIDVTVASGGNAVTGVFVFVMS